MSNQAYNPSCQPTLHPASFRSPDSSVAVGTMATASSGVDAHAMEHAYYRNGNIKGMINNTTAHALKRDIQLTTSIDSTILECKIILHLVITLQIHLLPLSLLHIFSASCPGRCSFMRTLQNLRQRGRWRTAWWRREGRGRRLGQLPTSSRCVCMRGCVCFQGRGSEEGGEQ